VVTQPAYIRNLKAYARRQFGNDEETDGVLADLSDESDRGAVILAATSIEDSLEFTIGSRMRNLESDVPARAEVFGPNGCVGTFSNKTLIAYAMGIIDHDTRKEIDLVREVRNACAHSRLPISFKTPQLQEAAFIVIGDEFLSHLTSREPDVIRVAFIVSCSMIAKRVITGRRETVAEAISGAIASRENDASQTT
jgi:hypothetical protein